MNKLEALKKYCGHDSFRPGQEALVDALLRGQDALGIMPTGAGKSLCYQLPAVLLEGVALVISPLISLMQDQVAALNASGIQAAYLNSSLTPRQLDVAMERARAGAYKIIYAAPERLDSPPFLAFARSIRLALVAVDEAHCVSQWGQDFRPHYLRIAAFLDDLPRRPPVGAFTATATQRVREDILRMLGLRQPVCVTTGYDRPNLFFEVLPVRRKMDALAHVLRGREGQCGIIYCATRKQVEDVAERLRGMGAVRYHAGLSDEERRQSQEDFQYDRAPIMVATNAFGMGIDKSNVRYIIHYAMPKSIEAYYQEAGRAGRDGGEAECILLYSRQDIITARILIQRGEPNPDLTEEQRRRVLREDFQRLNSMVSYCEEQGCLRAALLRYFGETAPEKCCACSRCTGSRYLLPTGPAPAVAAKKPAAGKSGTGTPQTEAPPDELLSRLKAVRTAEARRLRVPPYVILHDTSLQDMARRLPTDRDALLQVSGFGEIKADRYGEAFLQCIRAWLAGQKNAPAAPPPGGEAAPAVSEERAGMLRRGVRAGITAAQFAALWDIPESSVRDAMRTLGLDPGNPEQAPAKGR